MFVSGRVAGVGAGCNRAQREWRPAQRRAKWHKKEPKGAVYFVLPPWLVLTHSLTALKLFTSKVTSSKNYLRVTVQHVPPTDVFELKQQTAIRPLTQRRTTPLCLLTLYINETELSRTPSSAVIMGLWYQVPAQVQLSIVTFQPLFL